MLSFRRMADNDNQMPRERGISNTYWKWDELVITKIALYITDSVTWCRFSQVNTLCNKVCNLLLLKKYYKNGERQYVSVNYLPNGKKHGKAQAFCGCCLKLYKEFYYLDGVRHGLYIRWFGPSIKEDIWKERIYRSGEIVSFAEWYDDGVLWKEYRQKTYRVFDHSGRLVRFLEVKTKWDYHQIFRPGKGKYTVSVYYPSKGYSVLYPGEDYDSDDYDY